jgi:putative transcriptional regulator
MMDGMTGLTGQLLVATSTLIDPNFRRAVVLLLDHGNSGALGLVVNRPLDVDVSEVLPDWQPYTTTPGRLFQGGPVELDSALGLVAVPGDSEEPVGVRRLIGSLGLVDLDTPPEVVAGGLAGLRIFAGYAGWADGQLESEIEDGAWFVLGSESRDAFTDSPQTLWQNVLRRQGGELAMLSTLPEDPSMN